MFYVHVHSILYICSVYKVTYYCTDIHTAHSPRKAQPLHMNSAPSQSTSSLSSTSDSLLKHSQSHDHKNTPSPITPESNFEEDQFLESRSTSGSLESNSLSDSKSCLKEESSEILEVQLSESCSNSPDDKVSDSQDSSPKCVTVHPLSLSLGDQIPDSQSDRLVAPDKLLPQGCEENHESLHVNGTCIESVIKEEAAIGNGIILSNGASKIFNSNIESQSPKKPQNGHNMHSMNNGDLLQEAMNDISPHVQSHPIKFAVSSRLGIDGMPQLAAEVQDRIQELVMEPRREMERMRAQLKEIQLLVQKQGVGRVSSVEGGKCDEGMNIEDQIANALDDQVRLGIHHLYTV